MGTSQKRLRFEMEMEMHLLLSTIFAIDSNWLNPKNRRKNSSIYTMIEKKNKSAETSNLQTVVSTLVAQPIRGTLTIHCIVSLTLFILLVWLLSIYLFSMFIRNRYRYTIKLNWIHTSRIGFDASTLDNLFTFIACVNLCRRYYVDWLRF